MVTKTARAAEQPRPLAPEPTQADPAIEKLFAPERRAALEALSSERLQELRRQVSAQWTTARSRVEALRQRDLSATADAEIPGYVSELTAAEAELQRADHQGRALERALRRARAREADEAAARDAATAAEDVRRALASAEEADAAAKAAIAALHRQVDRLFDAGVRKRLTEDDPTQGLRKRILALCPMLYQLQDLEREGRSLVHGRRLWPRLVLGGDGSAHYEDLDAIRSREDLVAWQDLDHHPVPGGSQAARQRAELESRFAVRYQ